MSCKVYSNFLDHLTYPAMNISFVRTDGTSFIGQLKYDFSFEAFRSLINRCLDETDSYRFTIGSKELALNNPVVFNTQKHLFQNGTNIFVSKRVRGGGYVELSILKGIIINDLEQELQRMPTECDGERVCQVCRDCPNYMQLCCNRICQGCFSNYFESASFKLICMTCRREIPYAQFFASEDFSRALESFEQVRALMVHIDCQICHCGMLAINETLFSQQTCNQCERTFCFFCNKDWNEGDGARRNDRYTCHVNCDYETKLTYELVPLQVNRSIMIPNRRFCPFCYTSGAYASKCKYHTCDSCRRAFCFICLKEEEICKVEYQSNYQHQCTDTKIQKYSDFPTIATHADL